MTYEKFGRFEWWPVQEIIEPQTFLVKAYSYHWWVCRGMGKDREILVWVGNGGDIVPQCNPTEKVAKELGRQVMAPRVTRLRWGFIPARIEDYR